MKRFLFFSLVLGTGMVLGSFFARPFEEVPTADADADAGQGGVTVSGNWDVNGDNGLDLSDATYLLSHLFQGGPAPLDCPGGGGDCTLCEAALADCQTQLLALTGGTPEVCDNGKDDDLDFDIDCADSDCFGSAACPVVAGFVFVGTNMTTGFDEYHHVGTDIDFVLLLGGTFQMGSPGTEPNHGSAEGPVHDVPLSSFLIAKYAVTQAEYEAVITAPAHATLSATPSNATGDNLPVERPEGPGRFSRTHRALAADRGAVGVRLSGRDDRALRRDERHPRRHGLVR
jgi:hypothetical protein